MQDLEAQPLTKEQTLLIGNDHTRSSSNSLAAVQVSVSSLSLLIFWQVQNVKSDYLDNLFRFLDYLDM